MLAVRGVPCTVVIKRQKLKKYGVFTYKALFKWRRVAGNIEHFQW